MSVWVTQSKKLNKLVINADLKHLVNWLNANEISLNVKKSHICEGGAQLRIWKTTIY